MIRRRVKITGLGFVTPAGIGKDAFTMGILSGRSFVAPVTRFPEEAGPFVASEVKGFKIGDFIDDPALKRLPRHTQFAIAATCLAVKDAGVSLEQIKYLSAAVVIGASLMDSDIVNRTIESVVRKGPRHGLSRVIFQAPVSAIGATIAGMIGGARTMALQSACCAGSDAIGHAAAMVASGECDFAICGGTEAPISYHPMLELKQAGLSPDSAERPEQLSRPFDLWRTTGVIGEGACVIVLEPAESPRRGYAFVDGYAFASDTVEGFGEGLTKSIKLALANSGYRDGDIECISAWGPGHKQIDAAEAYALRKVFGKKLDLIPALSLKGAIGNPLGAAGAIQVGASVISMVEGFIPPTVNWQFPDPECPLCLSGKTRYIEHRLTLINSHGLSGTNSCLIISR